MLKRFGHIASCEILRECCLLELQIEAGYVPVSLVFSFLVTLPRFGFAFS